MPSSLATADFVAAAYSLALGRAPDAPGLAYWQGMPETGAVKRDGFMLDFISGTQVPGALSDQLHLANRALVGEHFALTRGLNDPLQAAAVMAGVGSGSIAGAIELIDKYAAADAMASDELIVAITGIVA